MSMQRLSDLDLTTLVDRAFHPSPAACEDEVLYFLMLDRFSDGREQGYRGNDGSVTAGGTAPPFQPADADNAVGSEVDARAWREAGLPIAGPPPPVPRQAGVSACQASAVPVELAPRNSRSLSPAISSNFCLAMPRPRSSAPVPASLNLRP